jgi:uncharacterized repeat protein (TIGR01451 family)/LPXTG-motif cell wall-anchored protein
LTKTDLDASVAEPGGDVTYYLEITNTSNEQVTITALTDVVTYQRPANVSGELDLLAPAAPVVSSTCTKATIGAGKTYTCEFVLTLSGTAQLVSDVAKVTVEDNDAAAGRIPPATATEDDSTPITDVTPVVEIVKTANPTTITPGQEVTFTYTIFNRSTVEDIEIVSLADDKFSFVAPECQVIGTTLTKNDGNDAGGTDQVTCEIKRTNLLPAAGQSPLNFDHKNVVVVEAADDEIRRSEEPEYVTDDDDAIVQVRTIAADLQIVKTASAPVVDQGQSVTFDLVVTNKGPDEATNVAVTDNAPSQLAVTAVTSSAFSCSNIANAITCTRAQLAVGASGTITVAAVVNAGVVGLVSNTAMVTARQTDPDPTNNTSTVTIDVPEVFVNPPLPPGLPLPATGSNINSFVAIAISMLMGGVALLLTTTRRRRA